MKTKQSEAHPGTIATAITRRDFLKAGVRAALVAAPGMAGLTAWADPPSPHVVSIVRIVNDNIEAAVEQAIDLLGGIASLTQGKNRILLKPNLVAPGVDYTTKPAVVRALAQLMQAAGKEVIIGEGSAGAPGFNSFGSTNYVTRCEDILNAMQQSVFDQLGYTALAQSLRVPLVNLHAGEMVTVPVPAGLFWKEVVLHRALVDCDLVVSVLMMKTHVYATVTLGLKNVIGLYPGAVYGSSRFWIHNNAASVSPGIAFEILDMARANKMGLTVIDAYRAMQGNGPLNGSVIPMNLIIAGTSSPAADMVGAAVMGFTNLESIPTLACAHTLGMTPATLADIEVRGEPIANVQRNFVRANVLTWRNNENEVFPAPKPRLTFTADGKGVVSWEESIPRPFLRTASDGKKYVASGSTLSVLSVTNAAVPAVIGTCTVNATSFQVQGQYLYAVNYSGVDVVDVSNPAQPVVIGNSGTVLQSGTEIQVVSNRVYVAAITGLLVFDVSVPSCPVVLCTNQTAHSYSVEVAAGYAYVTTVSGLSVMSLADPSQPMLVGTSAIGADGKGIRVLGKYCYVAVGNRLEVLDLSDPSQPASIGGFDTGGPTTALELATPYAFVAAGAEGLQILNLTNPSAPVLVGRLEEGGLAEAIQVVGNYAYLADGNSGLQVIDLANTNGLVRVGQFKTANYVRAVRIVGTKAYVGAGTCLQVLDVSTPTTPMLVGSLDCRGTVNDLQIVGNLAYVAANSLQIVDVSAPSQSTPLAMFTAVSSARAIQVVGQYASVGGYRQFSRLHRRGNVLWNTQELCSHGQFSGR